MCLGVGVFADDGIARGDLSFSDNHYTGTTFLPSGAKLTFAILKQASPNGMPIIVQHQRSPVITELIQSQIPANITQMTFSTNVHTPAFSLSSMVRPNGKNAKPAILKQAMP